MFSCQDMIYGAVLDQQLVNAPGTTYVYSDISMITMMFVIGTIVANEQLVPITALRPDCVGADPERPAVAQCFYEAFVKSAVLEPLGTTSRFLPPPPKCRFLFVHASADRRIKLSS